MEEIKNEILSNINILEILNRLNYCNQGIKNTKSFISNTKFYNLKEDLLRFIIKNSEKLNVNITPLSIQLKDKEQLFISLGFCYSNTYYFKFHQPYQASFYKKYFDLSKVALEEYERSSSFPAVNPVELAYAIKYLIKIRGKIFTDNSNFLRKSKILLYKELKEQYPEIHFVRKGNKIHLDGVYNNIPIKGSYKRTQLLTLFSEGEFETIINNIKK